jgi:hypothetical protein
VRPLREIPNPLLLEIAVRPWLRALSAEAGRPLSLAEVPDATLDAIAARGFHAVWLMGVWQTGAAGRALALSIADLCRAYERVLPDWQPADVDGSPYSIARYGVGAVLGGDDALAALRARLRSRGVRLVLDFVPNHVARDHPWLGEHPARFVRGSARDLARDPGNWFVHTTPAGEDLVFAHGRDPYFPGWTDTAQLDYRLPETRRAMTAALVDVATRCDGMRCDMAMLVLPDVFRSTWGGSNDACFWSEAIPALRRAHPDAWLMAEVYWGLEERLHALGFDATYDKELYDRLVARDAGAVRERIRRPEETHRHRVRFLENHDEARAMAVFGPERTRAAAAAAYTLPGIRFFYDGQAEGRRARVPIQLGRAPREDPVRESLDFYERLLRLLGRSTLQRGAWSALPLPDSSPLVGSRWTSDDEIVAVVANLGDAPASARVALEVRDGDGTAVVEDLASGERFERTRAELRAGVEWTVPGGGARFLRVAAG